ncbi:MAG: hypothetical protein JNM88_07555 [Chitinophagaceae bacterium]|nr:hypothetical protein [Chitinophagaceae bacterium]
MAKQYLSIIRLFEHCSVAYDGELNLPRIRKQLNAEFAMSGSGFIEAGGHSYTRQDVFEEIDHPDFSFRLLYHKRLWNSPSLLKLLEENKAHFFGVNDELKNFSGDDRFDRFFSPYFAMPFNYLSRNMLADYNFNELAQLLSYEQFLLPAEREEAFRPIRVFLEENLRSLRNTSKENYSIMRPKINHWVDKNWHPFFNNLPPEFYDTKNDFIILFINLCVALQKTARQDCRDISDQLIGLQETPEELRKIIVSNHAVFHKTSSTSSGSGNWTWIIWVVLILGRLATSSGNCGSDDKPDYKFELPKYPVPEIRPDNEVDAVLPDTSAARRKLDSILREVRKNQPGY